MAAKILQELRRTLQSSVSFEEIPDRRNGRTCKGVKARPSWSRFLFASIWTISSGSIHDSVHDRRDFECQQRLTHGYTYLDVFGDSDGLDMGTVSDMP